MSNILRRLIFLVKRAIYLMTLFFSLIPICHAQSTFAHVISPAQWGAYKQAFLQDGGRIVDIVNGHISHSEGQGYGLILSVANNDQDTFQKIWGWTQENLQRKDGLFAWQWFPDKNPHVTDWNNATDGDLLIAWGLISASRQWHNPTWADKAKVILEKIRQTLIATSNVGSMIIPAQQGFQSEGNLTFNLSYWIFPAFTAFNQVDPDPIWAKLSESGLKLLALSKFGSYQLPPDWAVLSTDQTIGLPGVANAQQFGFNAVRIPLYLCWAGIKSQPVLDAYASVWISDESPAWINLVNQNRAAYSLTLSQRAVRQLVLHCLHQKASLLQDINPNDYYGSTLVLLVLIAASGN